MPIEVSEKNLNDQAELFERRDSHSPHRASKVAHENSGKMSTSLLPWDFNLAIKLFPSFLKAFMMKPKA